MVVDDNDASVVALFPEGKLGAKVVDIVVVSITIKVMSRTNGGQVDEDNCEIEDRLPHVSCVCQACGDQCEEMKHQEAQLGRGLNCG